MTIESNYLCLSKFKFKIAKRCVALWCMVRDNKRKRRSRLIENSKLVHSNKSVKKKGGGKKGGGVGEGVDLGVGEVWGFWEEGGGGLG